MFRRHVKADPDGSGVREVFRRFWPYTRGSRRLLAGGGLLLIAAAACEVATIRLFGIITDEVLATGDLAAFWSPAVSWLGIAAVTAALTFGGHYLTALAGERFLLRLRDALFAHTQRLSPDFFDQRKLGDLMARMTSDVEAVEQLVASGVVELATSGVTMLFFTCAVLIVRWDLALVAFAVAPLFLLTTRAFTGRFKAAAGRERESNGAITSVVEENLSNQALVQAYNRQETEQRRLHSEGANWMEAKLTEARLGGLYEPLVEVVETVCMLVVLGVGAWEIAGGRLTIGGLLSFAAYLAYLYPPIQALGQTALTVSEAMAGSERISEIMLSRPAVVERPAARTRSAGRGRLAFDGVGFTYPGASRPTIERLTLRTDPGDLVLVVGPSGCGKSTITKLLLRFYDPTEGGIRLDGVPLQELSLHTLRENITVLPQESMLFPMSVHDNIAYGRPGAGDAEVVRAAVAAGAHEFIAALPQGYRTEVGQKGRMLSGGQRQRIAIARAMIRDAPVLVLDEPTTGLDEAAARHIMDPLRRLMAGRTTILITHDLHLAPQADKVIALRRTRTTAA